MKRLARDLAVSLVMLLGAIALARPAVAAKQAAKTPEPGLYEKQQSWSATMLSVRARYLRDQAAAEKSRIDVKPFSTESLSGDGPGQQISVNVAGWPFMRLVTILEQGGGNCHIWGDARLIAKDGSVTWLGSLKPTSINVGWGELLVDTNWQKHPLRIGTREFKHGIWVHADSSVAYPLGGKYERFEAWVGIDADRAQGAARFKVTMDDADLPVKLWRKIARDFPVHSRWFAEDAGRNYLAWFNAGANAQIEQQAIARVLNKLGPVADPIRKPLDAMRRAKVPADDCRWLDLYVRAARYQDCLELLDQIWIIDLRALLDSRVRELLGADVSPDDPRWSTIRDVLGRVVQRVPASTRSMDVAAAGKSVETLRKALPGRFQGDDALRTMLDQCRRRCQDVLKAVAQSPDKSLDQVQALAEEARQCRHALLLAMGGMDEFLAIPAHAAMEQEWERQHAALRHDVANRTRIGQKAAETYRPDLLVLESDRDPADIVLRRTAALLADLKRTSAGAALAAPERELVGLQAAAAAIDPNDAEARYVLFAATCRLRRQVALSNPLLNFKDLVFMKRHRATVNHMCDQYYGICAKPGGGLYVLADAFGPRPAVRDLLANSVVESGRLQGKKLSGDEKTGGSFLSPDLSFDARNLAFAYVECQGTTAHDHHTDSSRGHWNEGRCFHVFKVDMDGNHLRQLTDGTWNDFDPCWMPSGRIVFVSERRGGYLRCGRVCPTFTLYDMAADGRAIRCISYHETNEWHPSVAHDGMVMFTRWDYVDRHGCTAHLPWTITPDGRDPRAVHGNFAPRPSRPDMELDIRAIPGSHRYMATAAPHHGQAFGSIVAFDPHVRDDDGMAPVKRLTPDVEFPESQGGTQTYGEPWPLSDDYYLAVYDPATEVPGLGVKGNYGIYLIDTFGNKELIYRDAEIGCHNPMPLVPRPMPPVVPEKSHEVAADQPAEATVGVLNVYKSLLPWPEGTKIKSLRVYQILPLSVASAAVPHNTGLQLPQGSDSVNLARAVLGTVPVEADGSAYFTVPARRELYFQALDAQGLAITSMRSATQFQPGERVMCQGCHEPRHGAPMPLPKTLPTAMHRGPSRLMPDVDGTHPFSYPRLVQPVLDKHCVACHAKHPDKAAPLDSSLAKHPGGGWMNRPTVYFTSYLSLTPKYGFYDYGGRSFADPKWYRTTPGEFGARASKLYPLLARGHYDVKLTPEELHRIAIWLDSCSIFYGVYEKEGGEAQLRGEIAQPTLE